MLVLAAALASGSTRVDHGGKRWYLLLTANRPPTYHPNHDYQSLAQPLRSSNAVVHDVRRWHQRRP